MTSILSKSVLRNSVSLACAAADEAEETEAAVISEWEAKLAALERKLGPHPAPLRHARRWALRDAWYCHRHRPRSRTPPRPGYGRSALPARSEGINACVRMAPSSTLQNMVVAKAPSISGLCRLHPEFAPAVRRIHEGRVDLPPLVTHTFPMFKAPQAFTLAGDGKQAMPVLTDFADAAIASP